MKKNLSYFMREQKEEIVKAPAPESFKGITSVEDLENSKYISFTATEGTEISETAAVSLTGGDDGTTENADITTFIDNILTSRTRK